MALPGGVYIYPVLVEDKVNNPYGGLSVQVVQFTGFH